MLVLCVKKYFPVATASRDSYEMSNIYMHVHFHDIVKMPGSENLSLSPF